MGQPLPKLRLLPICAAAVLACSCEELRKTSEPPQARFQIITSATQTLRLDTASGRTWRLDGNRWNFLADSPIVTAEAGPYVTYRVVANRPDLSVFEKDQKQQPFVDERLRSIPGVVSVDLVKPNDRDPLGILNAAH